MEEDIRILETYLKNSAYKEKDSDFFKNGGWEVVDLEIPQAIEKLIKRYRELEEENKKLKASHIMTHNKASIEEKAKLFDVIDNSIDTYLEQTKPYWEQIMIKEKMTIEEAETIIDDMYQDRNKIISTKNDKGVTIHLDRLDDVKFTSLEFASVRALREIQSLRRKLDNSIPTSKIEAKMEEYNKRIEQYDEYSKQRLETDVEFYENIADTAIVQILEELLVEDK